MLNERGISLFETIAAAGISALVILGTSSLFVDSRKAESQQEKSFWLAARRIELQNLIKSTPGWNSIVTLNPNMNCFTTGAGCRAYSTPQPLKIPINATVLDGTQPTTGMGKEGNFCNSFDSATGDPACPVGIRLNWVALCDDSICRQAQPKISIQFQLKEPNMSLEDLKSFDLFVFKDPKLESLSEVCTSMGGVLTDTTCSIASVATACDPSNSLGLGPSYPIGFSNTGAVICGQPQPGTCAASDVAVGFNVNGGIQCASACTASAPITCAWKMEGPLYITFAQAQGHDCNEPLPDASLCDENRKNFINHKCIDSGGGICDALGCYDGFTVKCICK